MMINWFKKNQGSGKTMRHIKINSLKEIDEKKLIELIKLVHKKVSCGSCMAN